MLANMFIIKISFIVLSNIFEEFLFTDFAFKRVSVYHSQG